VCQTKGNSGAGTSFPNSALQKLGNDVPAPELPLGDLEEIMNGRVCGATVGELTADAMLGDRRCEPLAVDINVELSFRYR
jgi:hypothetical protein